MNFKISRPDRGRSGRLQPASRAGGRAWRRRFYPALPQGIAVDQVGKGVVRVHPRLPVAALRCLLLGSRQGAPLQKDIGLGEDASRLPCAGGCGIRWRRGVIENAHRAGRFDQAVPIAVPGREPGRGQRQDFIQIGQGQTAAGIPFERTGNAPVTLRTRQVYAERCNACSCLGDLRI